MSRAILRHETGCFGPDDQKGARHRGANIAPQPCMRRILPRIRTMMQPCASVGEAPGGGAILWVGAPAEAPHWSDRSTTTSDRHRRLIRGSGERAETPGLDARQVRGRAVACSLPVWVASIAMPPSSRSRTTAWIMGVRHDGVRGGLRYPSAVRAEREPGGLSLVSRPAFSAPLARGLAWFSCWACCRTPIRRLRRMHSYA